MCLKNNRKSERHMWNRMKEWLHHLRKDIDTPTLDDELYDSSKSVGNKPNKQFETKMIYQYPKQGNFRFPVIPDENSSKKQRKNRSTYNKNEESTYENNEYKTQARRQSSRSRNLDQTKQSSYNSENNRSNNTYTSKQDDPYKAPFSPSDVPSPIYGYGVRESKTDFEVKDIEEVPSYLRETNISYEELRKKAFSFKKESDEDYGKREELESEEEVENDPAPNNVVDLFSAKAENEKDQPASNVTTTEFSKDEEEMENYQTYNDSGEEMTHSPSLQMEEESEPLSETDFQEEPTLVEEVESHVELDSNHLSDGYPSEETDPPVIREYEEQEQNKELNEEVEQLKSEEPESQQVEEEEMVEVEPPQEKPKNLRPFNVIMTPRDKRFRDKKRTNDNKEDVKKERTLPQETQEAEKAEKKTDLIERRDTIPPIHMLNDAQPIDENDDEWIEEQMQLLETTLQHFHVKAKVVNAMKGPSVTRFEVQPEPGVKVSKITNLADDIKLNLAAKDIRMEAPIPGKNAIGIEVPNLQSQSVSLQEILESPSFKESSSSLSVGLGLDIEGSPVITDLKKMPHGLIAGATGSGKSVCINTILISLLYKSHYEDVKFLLIDPKMVELAPYNELPHLVAPVITDVKAATSALKWAVKEMDERYEKFVAEGSKDINRYNEKMKAQNRMDEKMPYLVIVIDELADLMMVSPQDVEDAISRIAQKARACGIHLLLATQRPSVDVITGLIKANIPTRIAFSVSSQVDSRTIIDSSGAEKLLGKGDMLFLENGSGKSQRIQGAFVSDEEIDRITNYVKKIAPPNYAFEQEELLQKTHFEEEEDELFVEAVEFVMNQNGASASLLQRRFKVGYNRAARLIDMMEEQGIISESKGSKPREVFMNPVSFEEFRNQ